MDNDRAIDPGQTIDWGRVSTDYAIHRPGPPQRFFDMLIVQGVGLPGQTILDLGTGTGVMARRFAAQGATASGIDIAENQIAAARELAKGDGLQIDFRVTSAENLPFQACSFDAVTAMQCWLYFDLERTAAEVQRVLRVNGRLVVSYFSWLPQADPVAGETERLVLNYNPNWTAGNWSGEISAHPSWTPRGFEMTGMFWFDAAIPFTRESWRGRMRACRGTGASLEAGVVARFDAELAATLERLVPNEFTVLHRVSAHLFRRASDA